MTISVCVCSERGEHWCHQRRAGEACPPPHLAHPHVPRDRPVSRGAGDDIRVFGAPPLHGCEVGQEPPLFWKPPLQRPGKGGSRHIHSFIFPSWWTHWPISRSRAGRSSEVERSLMVRWVVGSILHGVDPLNYFSLQPLPHGWCNKGRGMCYPVCGMVHIKEPSLLIGKSRPCCGSGFSLSLSEWFFTICLTPYNRK